jgi:hypothetical protein
MKRDRKWSNGRDWHDTAHCTPTYPTRLQKEQALKTTNRREPICYRGFSSSNIIYKYENKSFSIAAKVSHWNVIIILQATFNHKKNEFGRNYRLFDGLMFPSKRYKDRVLSPLEEHY